MENFPIFLNLKKKSVLVIGGGDIALRKVKLLIKVKPEIKIIANRFCEELECLATVSYTHLTLPTIYSV